MTKDKKVLYAISVSICTLLLLILFIPLDKIAAYQKVIAALLLIPAAILVCIFIKKRSVLSINKRTVVLLMSAAAALSVVLIYLTGLSFGYVLSYASYAVGLLTSNTVPIVVIIVTTEIIRRVLVAQGDRVTNVVCYVLCVLADIIATNVYTSISGFGSFINTVGLSVLPALSANLLYCYIAKRFGALPNILYRIVFTLYPYVLPLVPDIADSLLAVIRIILPIFVYLFIGSLFEEKRRYALGKKKRFAFVVPIVALILMISVVMLISCQFRYGAIIVGSDSMTGELNKGDALIYEQYDGDVINEGEVILFDKDGTTVIHRVVKIERINGVVRYYTKGDANEDIDAGYITSSDIIGTTVARVMFVGYPTLWLRSLVNKLTEGG